MGGRGTIARVRRVRVLCHGVKARATSGLGGLLVGGRQVVARVGRVRRSWGSRSVRVASVEGLHGGGRWLQRRQRLWQRRTGLQLVRGNGSGRRIGLGGRCVYTIGGIVVVTVHATARKDAVRVLKSARDARNKISNDEAGDLTRRSKCTKTKLARASIGLVKRSRPFASRARLLLVNATCSKEVDEGRCESLSRLCFGRVRVENCCLVLFYFFLPSWIFFLLLVFSSFGGA
jgi:hypothetical protein